MQKFKHMLTAALCTSLLLAGSYTYGQYCIPTSDNGCSDGDEVNSFVLNGEGGTGFNDVSTGCGTDGYDDRTAQTAVDLGQGQTYTASVSSAYYDDGDGDYCAIWIDLDDDSTFSASERVAAYDNALALSGSSVAIAIPAGAALGNHRMRVMVAYPYNPDFDPITAEDFDPCNTGNNAWSYGEVHDYMVNIVLPPNCTAPTNLNATGITGTSATLSWNESGTATDWDIEFGLSGFTPGSGTAASASGTPSLTISSGLPAGDVDFYVRADCSVSDQSIWAGPYTFTVPVSNDLPAGAITIAVDAACTGGYTNATATADIGEPGALCSGASEMYATVWFKFTAPPSGAVKISTDFNGYTLEDTRIALFAASDSSDYGTFESLACDEDNGVLGNDGYGSIIYAAGLNPGTTYYVVVDKYDGFTSDGTFCLEISTLSESMLSTATTCSSGPGAGASDLYMGWLSLVDENGDLIANVRPHPGAAVTPYYYSITPSISIHQGDPRTDANGIAYLDRNTFYSADMYDESFTPITDADMDLQLFFKQSELSALGVSLANLNVTHNPGSSCSEDFSGDGSQTALVATGNGTSGNASWIDITTPGFSNFFLMGGTTPLPVYLQSIAATNEGSSNKISWTTAREDNGEYFELEHSADGRYFSFLSKINAKGMPSDYTYWDKSPWQGLNYYRLKMKNAEGKESYSKVVNATMSDNKSFALQASPNPANSVVKISITGNRAAHASLSLTDITGRLVYTLAVDSNEALIDMSRLAQGIYLVRYVDDAHEETIRIGKQ